MCGIVGYVGPLPAKPILLDGLKRLEYRGYDSAGAAGFRHGELLITKVVGGVALLESAMAELHRPESIGIVHTRWATHGEPNHINAHPHTGCASEKCKTAVALVHNGTLDNFHDLHAQLLERGHTLTSETDTELLAHLIGEAYDGDPLRAIRTALYQVEGTYGLAILFQDDPNRIYFARSGSPLVLGVSGKGNFVASDALAFREYTDQMVELHDGCVGWISADRHHIVDLENVPLALTVETISWSLESADQGTHEHFMLKEITEQPTMVANALRGRLQADGVVKLGGLFAASNVLLETLTHALVGAGSSEHSAMIGATLFQELAYVNAIAMNASELANQKHPHFRDHTVAWALSQSGETLDLLEAMKNVRRQDVPCFGIVNKVGSAIARLAGQGVYIHAGLEVAVASTKAFTNQVLTLNLVAQYLRQLRGLPKADWHDRYFAEMRNLPALITRILDQQANIQQIAKCYAGYPNFLFLGRGINHPVALEGALKLKEIAYVNAIGYSAGEMKHGPIALIDGGFPTMVIALKQDDYYAQVVTNIQQIKARKGRVVAIITEGDAGIRDYVDDVIEIPQVDYFLSPLLAVVPLQLFAYHIAKLRGLNPDKPRNLAKSVTVK